MPYEDLFSQSCVIQTNVKFHILELNTYMQRNLDDLQLCNVSQCGHIKMAAVSDSKI